MKDPFVLFWSVLIFGSIFWYGFLVFRVGWKAGREIRVMTKKLGEAVPPAPPAD